jgi:hypothetical protein
MKLPIQMKSIITQLLAKLTDKKYLFKTIFIKGLLDESGIEALEIMKPRFVHLYSHDENELNSALFLCNKLLKDAFSFEVNDGLELPDESLEVSVALHEIKNFKR